MRELTRRFYSDESDLRGERDAYLAPLAAWCHVPPRDVNSLTVTDFILLVTWIDRKRAIRKDGNDL